jgi:hypothetical protein
LSIRCFFLFGTVRDLTQEHLAATVAPPKWRDGSSQKMDIIDAGQSAAGSDLGQGSLCTIRAARCLIGFKWY